MKLFEPLTIGTMTLRNHIVLPAMGTSLAKRDGLVSDRAIAYYSRRAAGGVGLVTLEVTAVHRLGIQGPRNSTIDRDECVEGLSRLARSVQAHGARFSVQLWHAGRASLPIVLGEQPVAPSPVPPPLRTDVPRELTASEIEDLVECFGEGARRAREAGCDAVEVHGAHGYLISQFLSPLSNKRTDLYGGDLANRARFALEIVKRIREKVGRDFPVLVKLSAEEHVDGGITLEETKTVARWLQDAGADALVISSGSYAAAHWMVQPMMMPRGCLVPYAAAVKSVVDVPVGAVGRINEPALAEKVLREGQADFVCLGRALLADPDFPRKAQEGRTGEIRSCTACCLCIDTLMEMKSITCMVNPEAGRELEWKVEPSPRPKRVLVVGAGPAGLEAARVASQRGHRVTVCDENETIGGQVLLASKPPSKSELKTIVEFYEGEMERRGIELRLGQKVTPETVAALAPEVVIVGAGSAPSTPPISGVEQANVVQARDVLADKVSVGGSAVIIGGGSVGCETAEYLRAQGLEVTVIEMLRSFGRDIGVQTRGAFIPHLRSMGVKMLRNSKVVRIDGRRVYYVDGDGQEVNVEGDTIVLAVGARPTTDLVDSLKARGVSVVAVGDCVEPGRIHNAIYQGAMAGREI